MPLASLKARIDRLPNPSRRLQLGFAIAVVVTQAMIAMTGAIVRVTGSGLGCPAWPQCFPDSMFPVEHPEFDALNQWIEYGNRLFTGVVGLIAGGCFVLAWLHRPRERRYVRLALSMPIGVVVQAILGGVTVRLDLVWWSVAVHLLASTVMVWLATLLAHAVPREGSTATKKPVPAPLSAWLYVQTALLAGILGTGTMVTGAGPHGGDPETPRLGIPVETMAHVHAAVLYTFLGSLILLGFWLRTRRTFRPPWRRYRVLVAVVLAQGAIGLLQFWTGVPEMLVSLHVLGAMTVIIATASLWCGIHDHTEPDKIDEVDMVAPQARTT